MFIPNVTGETTSYGLSANSSIMAVLAATCFMQAVRSFLVDAKTAQCERESRHVFRIYTTNYFYLVLLDVYVLFIAIKPQKKDFEIINCPRN